MSGKFDEAPDIVANYSVLDMNDVTVTITVGSGQFGTVGIRLAGTKVAAGEGRLHVNLGLGKDVRGKMLEILTVVQDVNPMTNRTEVTHVLTGGAAAATFPSEFIATRNGGVVFHFAQLTLT
jgi:hypothetical protein